MPTCVPSRRLLPSLLVAALALAAAFAMAAAPGLAGTARAAGTATLTGRVVDQFGHPVAGIVMSTYPDAEGPPARETTTSASGAFTFEGLTPGRTVLRSGDPTGGHFTRWWNGETSTTRFSATFDLAEGTTTIEFLDPEERRIEATAVDSSGHPIPGIGYRFEVRDPSGTWRRTASDQVADERGHFLAYTRVGGTYRFCFEDDYYGEGSEGRTERYANRCYRKATSIDRATSIEVTDGSPFDQRFTLRLAEAGRSMSPVTPFIYGQAYVGQTVRVDPGQWAPTNAHLTYQWFSGDVEDQHPIPGANGRTYRVQRAAAGQPLGVVVTGTAAGYKTASLVDDGGDGIVGTGAPEVTTSHPLRIEGAGRVGRALTARPGKESPATDYRVFTWLVGGRIMQSGSDPTYTPTAADAGQVVTLRYLSQHYSTTTRGDFRELANGPTVRR